MKPDLPPQDELINRSYVIRNRSTALADTLILGIFICSSAACYCTVLRVLIPASTHAGSFEQQSYLHQYKASLSGSLIQSPTGSHLHVPSTYSLWYTSSSVSSISTPCMFLRYHLRPDVSSATRLRRPRITRHVSQGGTDE